MASAFFAYHSTSTIPTQKNCDHLNIAAEPQTENLVAVTDLFSLLNALAKRFDHTLTNQRAERIDFIFLQRTIFSIPFWKSATDRVHDKERRKTLLLSFSTDAPALTIFTEDNCCYSYTLKKITVATCYTLKN